MADLGSNLRTAREAAGLSLSAMARRTHYSKALLGHLETGRRTVMPEHVTAYSRTLNVAVDRFYGPTLAPLRVAHEWLVSDSEIRAESLAGRRVGSTLVSELERRVVELRHLDDIVGGNDLSPIVAAELTAAHDVIDRCSYSEATGRRLLVTVGEMAQLAGWVASDAGHHLEAERVYLSGVAAASAAGDRVLAGQLLSSLSYQMANIGDLVDAALLARSAVKGASGASPVVRALLLERVAWSNARARDADGARRALDAVDDTYESRSAGIEEPEWTYWLNRAEIDVMAARCLIELGNPASAEPLLASAIATYDPEHVREVALYQTWLAESYIRSGDLDAGRATLTRARKLARRAKSARLTARVATVDRLLATN